MPTNMPGLSQWVEKTTGVPARGFEPIAPGAGRRRYLRVSLADGATVVLMHALAEDPEILPPALRRDDLPFVEVTGFLGSHGIPVPEILAVDRDRRWILLEDLGPTRLCDLSGSARTERLREAALLLARVHAIPPDALPFTRHFDAEWIGFELRYFTDRLAPSALRPEAAMAIGQLIETVASLPRVLSLRDYQSQNLMVDPSGRLRVLDYQDALLAPRELDLAAFLHDSYLDLEDRDRDALLCAYEQAARVRIDPEALACLVVQRKCKDVARFHHLVERGDRRYVSARSRARRSALEALDRAAPVLGDGALALRRVLEELPG